MNIFNHVPLTGEPFKSSAWSKTRIYRSAHSYTEIILVEGERLKCGDVPGKGVCGACLGGPCGEGVKLILSPVWEPCASLGCLAEQCCSANLVTLESTSAGMD